MERAGRKQGLDSHPRRVCKLATSVLDEYNGLMAPRRRELVLESRAAGQNDGGITAMVRGRVDTSRSAAAATAAQVPTAVTW